MKDLFVSALNDLYGVLLTEKQSQMIKEYYDFDYSLAEIAENHGISRQGVHIAIKQAKETLYGYEEKLKLSEKMNSLNNELDKILSAASIGNTRKTQDKLTELKNNLRSYYGTIRQSE